jgi:hypothetical protein
MDRGRLVTENIGRFRVRHGFPVLSSPEMRRQRIKRLSLTAYKMMRCPGSSFILIAVRALQSPCKAGDSTGLTNKTTGPANNSQDDPTRFPQQSFDLWRHRCFLSGRSVSVEVDGSV